MRESEYYIWLRDLVGREREYSKLIKQLDTIPYTWALILDKNRAEGGMEFRRIFAFESGTNIEDVRTGPCTVLEMLIGVASHMRDILEESISHWFWVLISNLTLDQFADEMYEPRVVEIMVNSWLNHNYRSNGVGSIFPLKEYLGDCRNIDIWTQMNAWINENYPQGDWLTN